MNKDYELEYLMNPTLYDKYQKLSSKERETAFLQDKQFYRKRIQQMAKDCAKYKLVKGATEPPKALMNSFDAFSKQCIVYFKTIDENECYQDEYNDMESINVSKNTVYYSGNHANEEHNINMDAELLGNIPERKVITMDEFVEKKKTKPAKPIHLPQQKNANVKDEKYRTKGLKKNKSKE